MSEHRSDLPPEEVLASWGLQGARCTRVTSGWINATFFVAQDRAGAARRVLQRLNPVFGAEVNEDIEAITAHLAAAGLITPRLLRTAAGALHCEDAQGAVWRLMSFVAGETLERADSAERCRAAGALVGRFHGALWDCEHVFAHRRLGIHDTARHMAALEQALSAHTDHRLYEAAAPLGAAILGLGAGLTLPRGLPRRVVHGDLKLTNILFAPGSSTKAVCLIDLDTLARMPLPLELGDALRSWCCPLGEDVEGSLELGFFEAGVAGYAAGIGGRVPAAERAAIPGAVQLIACELAARFCADALEERYFGWDRQRFGSAGEHNLQRAPGPAFFGP